MTRRPLPLLLPLALLLSLTACQDTPTATLTPEAASINKEPPPVLSLEVNSLDDVVDRSGCDKTHCSLREAIAAASPGATIQFRVKGTIRLTQGPLAIEKDLTISGPGAPNLSVSGNNASTVFRTVLGTKSTVSGLTITGASSSIARGGGIHNLGALTLQNTAVSGNYADSIGGGIFNEGSLTLQNSTVSGNRAVSRRGGGGIHNVGTLTLVNSTVSGNRAGSNGGGIHNGSTGALTLQYTTVVDNEGGGIHNLGALALQSSILANSTVGADLACAGGRLTDNGYNLVKLPDHCTLEKSTLVGEDPWLGALQDNGGPTLTHALLAGSPALDAVPVDAKGCSGGDQRGVSRPQGGACDIGAFEASPQAQSISFTSIPPTPALVGGSYVVSATASSGLKVSFSSLTPGVCTLDARTVRLNAAGTCTVAADQKGDASWQAAPQETQSFTVHPQLTLSIDESGSVNRKTGVATIRGSLTCMIPGEFTLDVAVSQQQAKGKSTTPVSGIASITVYCQGPLNWVAEVVGTNGKFVAGPANATASVADVDPAVQTSRAVQLK